MLKSNSTEGSGNRPVGYFSSWGPYVRLAHVEWRRGNTSATYGTQLREVIR
jgi:hypothetical protein